MPVEKNPVLPPEPDYDENNLPDGTYNISGIEFLDNSDKYTDDAGLPLYYSKNGGPPYIIVSTILEDGSKGPGFRILPGDVGMLVHVFGQDPAQLPSTREETKRLVVARELINSSGNSIKVIVKGGWINRVPAMQLPVGNYWARFAGVNSYLKESKGILGWYTSQFGDQPETKQFQFQLEIIGNQFGKEIPYTGLLVNRKVPYALSYDAEKATHVWDRTEEDSVEISTAAAQMVRVIETFAKQLFDADYENVDNIVPEFDAIARDNDVLLAITVSEWKNDSGKGTYVDLAGMSSADIVPLNMRGGIEIEDIGKIIDNVIETDLTKLDNLKATIQNETEEEAFDTNGILNAVGVEWCITNLIESGIWEAMGGPVSDTGGRSIEDLTDEHIDEIHKLLIMGTEKEKTDSGAF